MKLKRGKAAEIDQQQQPATVERYVVPSPDIAKIHYRRFPASCQLVADVLGYGETGVVDSGLIVVHSIEAI